MPKRTAIDSSTFVKGAKNRFQNNLPLYFSLLTSLCFFNQKMAGQDIGAPRFFELNVRPASASNSPVFPQAPLSTALQAKPNYFVEAKLRFPIKLKGNTRVIGELKYKNDFVNGYYSFDDDHFEELELRQVKGSILMFSQLNEKWKFTNALSVSSNSADFISTNTNAMQFRNISMFEKKLKNDATIGFGGSVTYEQNLTVLPIFKYETDFGNGWNLDMVLPKEIEVSKGLTKNSRLLFDLRGSSSNYTLGSRQIANDFSNSSIYKRMDVAGTIGYERQLTPWVGFSVHAGATTPIQSGLYANDSNQTQLHDFKGGISPYFRVGVFMSFPK